MQKPQKTERRKVKLIFLSDVADIKIFSKYNYTTGKYKF